MQRRTFLVASATAMALGPGWLRRAFADASLGGRRTMRGSLAGAREQARASGKPILVLVIPANPEEVDQRGLVLGDWLDGREESDLSPLALCEVVCAPLSELGLQPSKVEPVLVLLDGDQAVRFEKRLPADLPEDYQKWQGIIDGRVATLASWTRGAVMGTPALLEARAKRVRAVLPKEELEAIERKLARGQVPSVAETDRAAPLVAIAAAKDPRLGKLLTEAVRARWEDAPPKGSHWAHYANCAEEVEAEGMDDLLQTHSVGCGMGHTPTRSQRFLYFWTKPPRMLAKEEGGR